MLMPSTCVNPSSQMPIIDQAADAHQHEIKAELIEHIGGFLTNLESNLFVGRQIPLKIDASD
jgi:hypothetical protein